MAQYQTIDGKMNNQFKILKESVSTDKLLNLKIQGEKFTRQVTKAFWATAAKVTKTVEDTAVNTVESTQTLLKKIMAKKEEVSTWVAKLHIECRGFLRLARLGSEVTN